jgi:hypothetical protein
MDQAGEVERRNETIAPRAGRSWFLPFPKVLRIDPNKPETEDNFGPPKGEYTVVFSVSLSYFRVAPGTKAPAERPELLTWEPKLAPIVCRVSPDELGQDVLSVYTTPKYTVTIEQGDAVEIAKKAMGSGFDYDIKQQIRVELDDQGQYSVTFPFAPSFPPLPGPEFAAKVWVDGRDGRVIRVLVGH